MNQSRRPIEKLHFHLYLNAFLRGSRFLDPQYGGSRSGGLVGQEGKMTVLSLRSPTWPGKDLWKKASLHSPGYPGDRTDISVPLPSSIGPGERVTLEVEFRAVLPEIVERTGFSQDFHLLGQWFPKLAKLTASGNFDHDSLHPFAEFFADFSDYRVTLRVPSRYVVGSTGSLRLREERGDTSIYEARADGVIDFAWTAYPDAFLTELTTSGVRVRLLSPLGSPRSRAIHLSTIKRGLEQFGADYGAYPYPTLTVVQPPAHASRAGGMEYPTFITTGGSELGALLGTRQTELLVAHELAHQWFQTLVATNERKHPFLDEGLTSYAEWRYLSRNFGASGLLRSPWLEISREAGGRFSAFYGEHPNERLNQPAERFATFRSLAAHVYGRTPLVLMTLGRVYGSDRLTAALGEYGRAYRFRHPTPRELSRVLVKHLGRESRAPIRRLFGQPGGDFDLRVGRVKSAPISEGYRTTFEVISSRVLGLPVLVQVELEDGGRIHFKLSGDESREKLSLTHRSPLERIVVDPEHRLLIDVDAKNNVYRPEGEPPTPKFRALLRAINHVLLQFVRP